MKGSPRSFRAFWPIYLTVHKNPLCRGLHFVGTAGAILAILFAAVLAHPWWVPIGLVFAYSLAWSGHFLFEKNRPATFNHPLWSLVGDLRMFGMWVAGRLGPALAAAERSQDAPPIHLN